MEYVNAHYAERISLRDVARELSYSPAHLTDVVRRSTGTAVTAWIIKRRLDAARDLLGNDELTVAAVCERVGFNDLCYFTRQFVRLTGTTPGRYRARLRRIAAAGGGEGIEDVAVARSSSR
jgi:AraC-like DNA-binding protein